MGKYVRLFQIAFVLLLGSCSAPGYDSSTSNIPNGLQKSSIIDGVNAALSIGDCGAALTLVAPVYNSGSSDNSIRMSAASAYGCSARINVFEVLTNLLAFGSSLGGPGFWEFLVQEYPSVSSPDDGIPQAAKNATDALMATLKSSSILVPPYVVNSSTNNPGSLLVKDRLDDANAYLVFASMALMGSLMYRDGAPTSNNHKSKPLPWSTPATSPGNGCAFASALLNYYDGIQFLTLTAPANIAALYTNVLAFLDSSLNSACNTGCNANGCSMGCATCPTTLRSRTACTGVTTDSNSCAAAGIAAFVNASWSGPP